MLDKNKDLLKNLGESGFCLTKCSLQSMTGFASKFLILEPIKNQKISLSLSLKALNSKYLDISCKLPLVLTNLETEIIKLIKNKLYRGQIYLIVHISDPNAFKLAVEPSNLTISGYLNALEKIKKEFNLQGQVTIQDILKLPDIFILEEKGIDSESKNAIFDTVNHLIDELVKERLKEGLCLLVDLEKRIDIMQNCIDKLSEIFENTLDDQKDKVNKRISQINDNNESFADAQRQALYNLLDKIDIHEEIVRFKTHIKNFSNFLYSKNQEKGKQLDFILQELSREINTIAAKTPNSQISELAISIKVEIEKAREQTQNVV